MHILMIIPGLSGGGAEKIVRYLACYLPGDFTIDILIPHKENCPEFPENVRVIPLSGRAGGLSIPGMWRFLLKAKREGRYDIYNSHMASCNFLNLISGNKSGKRILTIHSMTSLEMRSLGVTGWLYHIAIRLLYSHADYIVAVSRASGRDMEKTYRIPPGKLAVIPDGIDIKAIHRKMVLPLPAELRGKACGKPLVCAVGRYARVKGFSSLIYAFRRVRERYPDAKLVLAGEGELRGDYERLIAELKLDGSVVLTGWLENPYSLMRRADMLVSCSAYEGFGLAAYEAAQCGTPCILAGRAGGIEELFGHMGQNTENLYLPAGVLCPAVREKDTDQKCLADAMLYLWENPAYAAACAKNSAKAGERYSAEHMAEQWARLMRKAAGERQGEKGEKRRVLGKDNHHRAGL